MIKLYLKLGEKRWLFNKLLEQVTSKLKKIKSGPHYTPYVSKSS